jgi:hypothetical protein
LRFCFIASRTILRPAWQDRVHFTRQRLSRENAFANCVTLRRVRWASTKSVIASDFTRRAKPVSSANRPD